jgi:uncharacterized protein YutE (UPF0331/DUF86 family)
MSNECDAVVLHLWQAMQLAIDLAVAECVARGLGSPPDYASAFRELARCGAIEEALGERLVRAVAFRNVVAHAYDTLDLRQVWLAGKHGPTDLRNFLAALALA